MVDPAALLAALSAAADTIDMISVLRSSVEGDELDRVLTHLDSIYGQETGLSAAQLETWKEDEEFLKAFVAVSFTSDWDAYRGALVRAVLGLTAEEPDQPSADETELAEAVVGEIELQLPLAKKGDDVTRYVGKQHQLAIERLQPGRPEFDWAPERGSDLFDELVRDSETEAAQVQRALKGRDLSKEIPALLDSSPGWLEDSSGLVWEVIAASAEGVGLWPEAGRAWEKAFDTAGSDRVRTRVRLATAAHIAGDASRGRRAFAEAEALDAAHPLVLFTKAEQADDPGLALSFLDRIEPSTGSHRSLRRLRRAVPLAELGRVEEADEAIRQAVAEDAPEAEVCEVRAAVTLEREEPAFRSGARTDTQGLREAADHFLEVRDKHRGLNAHEGSVAYLCHAIDALLMADERGRALSLMAEDQLTEGELSSSINRQLLAQQLLRAGRSDLATRLLPDLDDHDEASKLLHAMAAVQGGAADGPTLKKALETLDAALDGDRRLAAAQARLIASLRHGFEWSSAAEDTVAEVDPGLLAAMRAQWLAKEESWEEAEATLLPHFAEPRAQLALLEIAIARDDRDRIGIRATEILHQPSDPAVRLEAARALTGVDEAEAAETELGSLAESSEVPVEVREAAFAELAEILTQSERHLDLLATTDAWLGVRADAVNAAWGKVHALFRLGRFREALGAFEEAGVVADSPARVQLLARIYGFALDGREAVQKIVEVAETLDAPDEAVEALALFAAIGCPDELPVEFTERLDVERFLRLFPGTTLIQKVDVPTSAEGLVELLKEMGGDRNQRLSDVTRAVFDEAAAPVALIAIVAGRGVGETWRGLNRRPVGFGHQALLEDERAFAANALALGAVWDAGALYLVEAIGGRLPKVVRRLLPKGVISQATLDDVMADSGALGTKGDGSTIGLDEEGRLFMTEPTVEERCEEAELRQRIKALAGDLSVEPDSSQGDVSRAGKSIREGDDLQPQLFTVLGSLAVAERLRLPLFSADRFVRLTARRTGIRTFGVEAVIDALADRDEISTSERAEYRRRLRALGGMGTGVKSDELAADARIADFELSRSVAFALQDDTPLKIAEADWSRSLLDFLKAVHSEAPGKLGVWTARVMDALARNHRFSPSEYGARLLALSSYPETEEAKAFTKALGSAVILACERLGDPGEPVEEAARLVYHMTRGLLDWLARGFLVARFANLMPPGHSFRARFVIFEGPDGPDIDPLW